MKSSNTPYGSSFYATYADISYRSASAILSVVRDLIRPTRVVDVGCGVGTWLNAWEDMGLLDVRGIDGEYVDLEALRIDRNKFLAMDLCNPGGVPGSPFDLVQSLEVGEHLPEALASQFVRFLCSLAPAVLFSAAIPHQGGTSHVNEQWPEYWADLFNANGYAVFDAVRPRVWDDPRIAYYYAQNTLLFVSRKHVAEYPALVACGAPADARPLARVHPRKWEERVNSVPRLEDLVAAIPRSAHNLVARALRKAQRQGAKPCAQSN